MSFILKTIWQCLTLLFTLIWNGRFEILLVQNPPAIPSLAVCWFYCFIFRSKLIIDWHNYAFTILSLSLGQNHSLVKISRYLEHYFGKLAHFNICVTNAMRNDLEENWDIRAVPLHDRPGPLFVPKISEEERTTLFTKLSAIDDKFLRLLDSNCPGLVVSSTSWTEDEDFSILLEALIEYDQSDDKNVPLLCVITGKGPLKQYYLKQLSRKSWNKVQIITPWLEAEDYPRLLACANLGVCLHTSSSGLDLPMKVVDMFGCGLPVCAYNYPCLSELVRHNENGFVFDNSHQLASQLLSWFEDFPGKNLSEIRFREEADKFSKMNWHSNWQENVSNLF